MTTDALPKRVKLLSWGVNDSTNGPVIVDEKTAEVFYDKQRKLGRTRVPLDYEHNTVPGTTEYERSQEPRPIAAMATPELVPGDGLYLTDITYTSSGREYAALYEDISAAPYVDTEGRVLALHSAALTRTGAVPDVHFSAPEAELSAIGAARIAVYSARWPVTPQAAPPKGVEGGHKSPPKGYPKDADLYADPKNFKYPLDTEKHVRAAWSYIHMPRNQEPYTKDEVEYIKRRIRKAAKRFGIDLEAEAAQAEAISATNEESMDTEEVMTKFNELLARLDGIEQRLKQLEDAARQAAESAEALHAEQRKALMAQAAAQGKVVPLTDQELAALSTEALRKLLDSLPSDPKLTAQAQRSSAEPASPVMTLRAAVETKAKELGSRSAALRAVIAETPEVYRAYLDAGAGPIRWAN